MPLSPDAVGVTGEPVERSWTSKDCLLYALGVGAGQLDAVNRELAFTTENSYGIVHQALPTFAVIVGASGPSVMNRAGSFDMTKLVHGEQGLYLHRPVPVEGRVRVTQTITGIYDKGSGGVIATASEAVDAETGEPMFTTTASSFVRGEGGWGGDRGPSIVASTAPDRPADHEVTYRTRRDQALLYRLSGDRNPLHSDPLFAAAAGFDSPILHGLCTYGFIGRALLHTLCLSDPAQFISMEARFSKPVLPGDELAIQIWVDGDSARFQAVRQDGDLLVERGHCRFALASG